MRRSKSASAAPNPREDRKSTQLLLVVPNELLKRWVGAQGSNLRVGCDGGEIAVTKVESLLQRRQSFLFVTLRGIGGPALADRGQLHRAGT
jgi:hypothetical protein